MAMPRPNSPPPVNLPSLPTGWKRLVKASKEMADKARVVLKSPKYTKLSTAKKYGTGEVHQFANRVIAYRWEAHWDNHPSLKPGQREDDPGAPKPYWHPGISLWEQMDPSAPIPEGLEDLRPTIEAPFVLAASRSALTGDEIAKMLPGTVRDQNAARRREEMILEFIRKGNVLVRWTPITVDLGSVRATFFVTAEPLMLGKSWDDGWYPGVSAATMQKIADYFNATMLTPKLVDEVYKQAAFRVDPPVLMPGDEKMADTGTMLAFSKKAKDRIRAARQANRSMANTPLMANIGKYWTVGAGTSLRKKNPDGTVAPQNYGFFYSKKGARNRTVTGLQDVDLYQTPGYRHNLGHADYSQVVMLVSRSVELCEPTEMAGFGSFYSCPDSGACQSPGGPGRIKCVDIYDLASDPELSKLLSHEGVINMRMPDIEYEKPEVCVGKLTTGLAGLGATPAYMCGGDPGPGPKNIGEGAPFDAKKAALVGVGVLGGAFLIYRLARS